MYGQFIFLIGAYKICRKQFRRPGPEIEGLSRYFKFSPFVGPKVTMKYVDIFIQRGPPSPTSTDPKNARLFPVNSDLRCPVTGWVALPITSLFRVLCFPACLAFHPLSCSSPCFSNRQFRVRYRVLSLIQGAIIDIG